MLSYSTLLNLFDLEVSSSVHLTGTRMWLVLQCILSRLRHGALKRAWELFDRIFDPNANTARSLLMICQHA